MILNKDLKVMKQEGKEKQCESHLEAFSHICLDGDCTQSFLLCKKCHASNTHKHSKTTIEDIKEVQQKLKNAFELQNNKVTPYFQKVKEFYRKLREEILKMIESDEKTTAGLLEKISYHHLPMEANSICYLSFKNQEYEKLDKDNILKLIDEAESGDLNKNLEQQKELLNLMDVELGKVQDKILSLKYLMPSKKLQVQLLLPKLSESSKICQYDEFCKIYSLFSSRKMLIRHVKLVYRTSDEKMNPKDYYNSCNNLLNCIALVKLHNGKKVGGYSVIPFVSSSDEDSEQISYQEDRSGKNFIFSISSLASFSLKDRSRAIGYRKDACGPIFGCDLDLSSKNATSRIGESYEAPIGVEIESLQSTVFLLGGSDIAVKELQIWQLCF